MNFPQKGEAQTATVVVSAILEASKRVFHMDNRITRMAEILHASVTDDMELNWVKPSKVLFIVTKQSGHKKTGNNLRKIKI